VAGPLTAVLLADQGADVIHVDPPGGPRGACAADAFLNRGGSWPWPALVTGSTH